MTAGALAAVSVRGTRTLPLALGGTLGDAAPGFAIAHPGYDRARIHKV
jgi:hypothetical protein